MKTVTIFTTSFTLTAILASDSWALSLGDLTLNSYLNEPISAQIELLDAGAIDESDVRISLATDAEFDRFGISRSVYLTHIRFEIETTELGKFVALSALEPLREAYLEFVVEARWPAGRLLRDYAVLIDVPSRLVSQTDVRDIPLSDLSLANATASSSAVPAESKYVSETSKQPNGGSAYLVKTTDTLWSIATRAAPDDATIEQTMLAIVSLNPSAFVGQNVNGLESGYFLLLPDNAEGMLDPITAIAEVARQNMEWQRGLVISESGLRPVSGMEVAREVRAAEPGLDSDTSIGVTADQQRDFTDAGANSNSADQTGIASLKATIIDLETSLQGVRSELADKDAELIKLRAKLSERQASSSLQSEVVQPKGNVKFKVAEMIGSFWPWIWAVGGSMLGLFAISRVRGARTREADEASLSPPQTPVGASSESNARATEILEEVEIYKTYGRTDQAIEMLIEAVNEGFVPPELVLCLLECYIESDRVPEAKTLIGNLELSQEDDLVDRANQIMFDAGLNLVSEELEVKEQNASEDRLIEDKNSVLDEPSFSNGSEFASAVEDSAVKMAPLEKDVLEGTRPSDEGASIYGLEADPIDSQLDLARAYIDMGDEVGARPVLMAVIKEGDLSQQAEARELLLRIEVT